MTRKDFVILAEEIRKLAGRQARLNAAVAVAAACARVNPRFDQDKFFKECGL